MSVFFSNVDIDDLRDNSKHYNFYLSIVTNNKDEWYGRVGIEADSVNIIKIRDSKGNFYDHTDNGKVNYYMECAIKTPFYESSSDMTERFAKVLQTYKDKMSKPVANLPGTYTTKGYSDAFYGYDNEWAPSINSRGESKITITSVDLREFIDFNAKTLEQALRETTIESFSEDMDLDDQFTSYIEACNRTTMSIKQEVQVLNAAISILSSLSIASDLKTELIRQFREGVRMRNETLGVEKKSKK